MYKKIIRSILVCGTVCCCFSGTTNILYNNKIKSLYAQIEREVNNVFSDPVYKNNGKISNSKITYRGYLYSSKKRCAIYSKLRYNSSTYSLIQNGIFSVDNNRYLVVYMNETPVEGMPVSLGQSQGCGSTAFSYGVEMTETTTYTGTITSTESIETEAWGHEVKASIHQAVSMTHTYGSTKSMSFDFSYDVIGNSNIQYFATLTPYSYKFILQWIVGDKNTYFMDYEYHYAIKEISVSGGI